jgi:hypothetical protein
MYKTFPTTSNHSELNRLLNNIPLQIHILEVDRSPLRGTTLDYVLCRVIARLVCACTSVYTYYMLSSVLSKVVPLG